MILPASWLDGLTSLDVQQPGPLIDHLLEMPQGQPLPGPAVHENVPLLPVPHIMPKHLTGIAGELHGLGRTRDVAPGPAVVLALGPGEGDLTGIAVEQLDPNLPSSIADGWQSVIRPTWVGLGEH